MTVELDSVIRSSQKLDGENEDLTLILRKKKWKFWQINKQIVKNQKLATQYFLFNMHINVPFGNI